MKTIFQKIEEQCDGKFRAATDQELASLIEIGAPESLLEHFAKFAPDDSIEGQVVIADIDRVISENTEAVPGCATSPHGVYVIASTFCGDAYCLDTNVLSVGGHPRVVFVSF